MAHLERFDKRNIRRNKYQRMLNDGPFEITIEGDAPSDIYFRRGSAEMLERNKEIQAWTKKIKTELVAEIKSQIDNDVYLSKSLKAHVYADKKRNPPLEDYEINRVGFTFRPEGVYVHLGVGRGYYRSGGVTIKRNKSENIRRQQAQKSRVPKPWFNTVLRKHMAELQQIVSKYSENEIINYTNIFIRS